MAWSKASRAAAALARKRKGRANKASAKALRHQGNAMQYVSAGYGTKNIQGRAKITAEQKKASAYASIARRNRKRRKK